MPRRDAFVNRRARLPNRRLAETFDLEIGGLRVDRPIATAPLLIALQYGVPDEILRHALMRSRDDSACGPLGAPLDIVAGQQP
jgi:hypothetical protein